MESGGFSYESIQQTPRYQSHLEYVHGRFLSRIVASGMASAISRMLNFNLSDPSIPPWVMGVQLLAGVLVPLLIWLFKPKFVASDKLLVGEGINLDDYISGDEVYK